MTGLARSAILASDLVVIPTQPSALDVWACQEVIGLIDESRVYKETLKSVFAINRRIVNTAIGRDVKRVLGELTPTLLETTIANRVIFAESVGQGLSASELDAASIGAEEIRELVEELQQEAAR